MYIQEYMITMMCFGNENAQCYKHETKTYSTVSAIMNKGIDIQVRLTRALLQYAMSQITHNHSFKKVIYDIGDFKSRLL